MTTLWRRIKSMTTGTATLAVDPKQKREEFLAMVSKHKEKLLAMTPARDAVLAAADSLKDLQAAVKKLGKGDDFVVVSNNRKSRPVVV